MSTFKNFVQCRVTTPISAVADSIGLYAAVAPYSLPSEEGGLLVLTDSPTKPSKVEVISYTSRSVLGLYGVTRGLEGTTAQAWTGPVYCYQSLLAGEFKTLLDSKADLDALGTAATKDVGTSTGNVMQVGTFGYGSQNPNNNTYDVNNLPAGQRISLDGVTEANAVAQNLPALGGSGTTARSWHVECVGRGTTRLVQTATEVYGVGTTKGRTFTRVKHDANWSPWQEVPKAIVDGKLSTSWLKTDVSTDPLSVTDVVLTRGAHGIGDVGTNANFTIPTSLLYNSFWEGNCVTINSKASPYGSMLILQQNKLIYGTLNDTVGLWAAEIITDKNQVVLGTTAATARAALELGTAATKDVGTAAGTVAQGNDSRIVNAVPNSRTITAGTGLTGGGDMTANRTLNVSYGTAAGTAAQGNDSRVVNALQKGNNLSDVADKEASRTNLGLNLTDAEIIKLKALLATVSVEDEDVTFSGTLDASDVFIRG